LAIVPANKKFKQQLRKSVKIPREKLRLKLPIALALAVLALVKLGIAGGLGFVMQVYLQTLEYRPLGQRSVIDPGGRSNYGRP
jgi:hypothetical protein